MSVRPFFRIPILAIVLVGCGTASPSVAPATTTAVAAAPTATAPSTTATAAPVASPAQSGECAAGPDEVWLSIDAKSNIFGAGLASMPDPAGGGGGLTPPVIELPDGDARIVTVPCTAGLTDCCSSAPVIGPEGYAGQPTDIDPLGGISGIKADAIMFLAGVFITDEAPAEPAPESLDFTDGLDFARLEPELGQLFFIGDGEGRAFVAPEGATRLYLGFVDGLFAAGPPGYYGNNRGALEATVAIAVE